MVYGNWRKHVQIASLVLYKHVQTFTLPTISQNFPIKISDGMVILSVFLTNYSHLARTHIGSPSTASKPAEMERVGLSCGRS